MRNKSKMLGTIIKILLIVAVLAIGVTVYSTCSGSSCIRRIDQTLPDATTAPYEVATQTTIYYAGQAYKNDDKSVTMLRWYERIDGKWKLQDDSITLPAVLKPRISNR